MGLWVHDEYKPDGSEWRMNCRVCRHTFLARRYWPDDADDGAAGVKERLMLEAAWAVRCGGETVGTVARRLLIDWATCRRWVQAVEAELHPRPICAEMDATQLQQSRGRRRSRVGMWDQYRARNLPWEARARVGEMLYAARELRALEPAKLDELRGIALEYLMDLEVINEVLSTLVDAITARVGTLDIERRRREEALLRAGTWQVDR